MRASAVLPEEWNGDTSLATMLVALAVLLFVALPLEGTTFAPFAARVLTVSCYTVLGVAGVLAVTRSTRARLTGLAFAFIPAGLAWIEAFRPGTGLGIPRSLISTLALLLLAGITLRLVLRPGHVTRSRIGGAIAVYLLIALAFGEVYWVVMQLSPEAIRFTDDPGARQGVRADLVYFSIATVTTLGFGDILPISTPARVLVTLEALFGQLYLVVLVGRLVSLPVAPGHTRTKDDA